MRCDVSVRLETKEIGEKRWYRKLLNFLGENSITIPWNLCNLRSESSLYALSWGEQENKMSRNAWYNKFLYPPLLELINEKLKEIKSYSTYAVSSSSLVLPLLGLLILLSERTLSWPVLYDGKHDLSIKQSAKISFVIKHIDQNLKHR